MKNILNASRIKIIVSLLLCFGLVKLAAPQVFLAETPYVSPVFIARLKKMPETIKTAPQNLMARLKSIGQGGKLTDSQGNAIAVVPTQAVPQGLLLKTIAKGVNAMENPQTGESYVQMESGVKYRISGTVTVNGKQYPKIEFVE